MILSLDSVASVKSWGNFALLTLQPRESANQIVATQCLQIKPCAGVGLFQSIWLICIVKRKKLSGCFGMTKACQKHPPELHSDAAVSARLVASVVMFIGTLSVGLIFWPLLLVLYSAIKRCTVVTKDNWDCSPKLVGGHKC